MWLLYFNIALYEKPSLPVMCLMFYFYYFYKIQNTTEETNTEMLYLQCTFCLCAAVFS